MSDKSDTPRTDERCAAIMAWQAKESDWPDFARQLERELAEARAERNAAIARSMSNAMEAQAHEDRARMAEAECERLRGVLENIRKTGNWWEQAQAEEALAAIDAARKP